MLTQSPSTATPRSFWSDGTFAATFSVGAHRLTAWDSKPARRRASCEAPPLVDVTPDSDDMAEEGSSWLVCDG